MTIMTKVALGAATAVLALAANTASAQDILRYDISRTDGLPGYTFQFDLDTSRDPSFQVPNNVTRFSPTQITYTVPGSSTPIVTELRVNGAGPSFFTQFNQGGISLLRLPQGPNLQPRFFGPALFTGTTADPQFLTGTFALTTEPRNNPSVPDTRAFNYQVTVTPLAGAVPEPSTWALLILGFGAVGGAMRSRSQAKIAFA